MAFINNISDKINWKGMKTKQKYIYFMGFKVLKSEK